MASAAMVLDFCLSLCVGGIFGAALTLSRVYHPSVIINQMRLTDFHMLEVFLTAGATSALVMLLLEKLKVIDRQVRPNSTLGWFSAYDGNVVGGAMTGLGMSMTGACPGTVVVQLAQGIPSSRITIVGALGGAMFYAHFGDKLRGAGKVDDKADESSRKHTIAAKLQIQPQTVFLTLEIAYCATIALSSLVLPGKSLTRMPTVVGGLLIGAAQTASILVTSTPLGASAAYNQAARLFLDLLRTDHNLRPRQPPKAIFFALGMAVGSVFVGEKNMPYVAATSIVPSHAFIGGFIMACGAKMAGGCTSGHGLSGLSALSFSSLLTVVSMFGAGIAGQWLLM